MVGQYAFGPTWNKAESLIIPQTTTNAAVWADPTVGGASTSTNAAVAGTGKFWTVEGMQVNLDADSTAILITISSMDDDKTTALEAIVYRFYGKGTYVVPVFWKAQTANKRLKINITGDSTTNVYVRAFGVRPLN